MSPGVWRVVTAVSVLGFVASGLVASRLRPGRSSRVEAQILAAGLLGGIPAVGIFILAWTLPGMHVVGVALGCGVGGILGTAGAWAVRDVRGGCPRPALAFVGTLAGATLGSAVGAALVFAAFASGGQPSGEVMLLLAAGYVGSSATLGFQIGAG